MNFLYLWLIPSCIGIAYIDSLLFSRWTQCKKCGHKEGDGLTLFLLPTVLEILLFLAGVAIGRSMI
jgi:hypothetical protein